MRKQIPWLAAVLLTMILLPASRALAWIEAGHRETALIAWEDLTPATRAKVTEILKQHPRYQKDLLDHLPANYAGDDISKFAFTAAAIWPDTVRSFNNPMHATHNHPAWHYIDIPYAIDGQPVPPAREGAAGKGPSNIVEALAKNVADLKDPAASPADQAVAICWVAHLCGDIHQPLHACTLYSPQFPTGDRGGNSFMVMRDPPYADSVKNLHFVWDSMPGEFKSVEYDAIFARGLRSDPKFSREKLKDALAVKDFAAWANESHALAIQYAYLNGKLAGGTKPSRDGPATRPAKEAAAPGLPPDYIRNGEAVAAERVVLGGYRLADLLNSIYDPKPTASSAK
ncbi:MAG TPA: S1/P1 nuclease [Tepidisphaeraceae bacterium]|nr:S1/P1 nuclease [Tepidisphaeraceae bacterium]